MNSQSLKCSGGPSVLPCILYISQAVRIPIKQKPVMTATVHFAEGEEFKVDSQAAGRNCKVSGRDGKGKFTFIAPSFAEMMLDFSKLEAVLLAMEKGNELVVRQQPHLEEGYSGLPGLAGTAVMDEMIL
jgi:hypothetical protein